MDNESQLHTNQWLPRKMQQQQLTARLSSKWSMNHLLSDNVHKLDNSNKLSMLLKDNIVFLKEKINKKDRVMDSLLSQLSKKNYLTP